MEQQSSSGYIWKPQGKGKDIALLATSNCFSDQKILHARIDALVKRGYKVHFVRYDDGNIISQKEL